MVVLDERDKEKMKIVVNPAEMEGRGPGAYGAGHGAENAGQRDRLAAAAKDKKHGVHPFPGNIILIHIIT